MQYLTPRCPGPWMSQWTLSRSNLETSKWKLDAMMLNRSNKSDIIIKGHWASLTSFVWFPNALTNAKSLMKTLKLKGVVLPRRGAVKSRADSLATCQKVQILVLILWKSFNVFLWIFLIADSAWSCNWTPGSLSDMTNDNSGELRAKLNIKYRSCSSWFLILSIPREVLILGQLEIILFTICSVEAYETTAKGYKKANSSTRFSVGDCGLSFLPLRNPFGSLVWRIGAMFFCLRVRIWVAAVFWDLGVRLIHQ